MARQRFPIAKIKLRYDTLWLPSELIYFIQCGAKKLNPTHNSPPRITTSDLPKTSQPSCKTISWRWSTFKSATTTSRVSLNCKDCIIMMNKTTRVTWSRSCCNLSSIMRSVSVKLRSISITSLLISSKKWGIWIITIRLSSPDNSVKRQITMLGMSWAVCNLEKFLFCRYRKNWKGIQRVAWKAVTMLHL